MYLSKFYEMPKNSFKFTDILTGKIHLGFWSSEENKINCNMIQIERWSVEWI
jgi:hypothetical protein